MPQTRITISLPASLVRAADARARKERRSRSWLVAEALRRFLTAPDEALPAASHSTATYSALAPAAQVVREQHLVADQRLSPAQRLARAEALGALAREQQGRRTPREQVIAFDDYDDYYRWKTARLIGG